MQVCISKVACNNSEPQPLDNFYTHPAMANGHLGKCKECCKLQQREKHKAIRADPELLSHERSRQRVKNRRQYERNKHKPEWRQAVNKMKADWRANNPEKRAAHLRVQYAIKKGELKKPGYCQECGFYHPIIEAHHPDYSKPLEVVWLCKPCHVRETFPTMRANS